MRLLSLVVLVALVGCENMEMESRPVVSDGCADALNVCAATEATGRESCVASKAGHECVRRGNLNGWKVGER